MNDNTNTQVSYIKLHVPIVYDNNVADDITIKAVIT